MKWNKIHHFGDRLTAATIAKRTPLVVGLDPRFEQIPSELIDGELTVTFQTRADVFEKFCCEIIDVVAPLVPAVKPQAAFFEKLGPVGMIALQNVVDHAVSAGLMVIMDAKRGDIGSTAEAYAEAYLGRKPASVWGCDALTVNPYLGADSLTPFHTTAQENGAGIYVLVKTSNPGSKTFQELPSPREPLFKKVGEHVQELANQTAGSQSIYGSIGAVVGATYPDQLAELRELMPNVPLLIPGLGAQGGTAKDVAAGFDENGLGAVINSSRAIIFAHSRKEFSAQSSWQKSVEAATRATIQQLASETSAGKLGANLTA